MNTEYYDKYLKYKKKYMNLKTLQTGGNDKKYAIVNLCMLKDHYVIGA